MASLEEAARAFQPDILISVYYRKIIPQAILDIPPKVTYPNGSASGLRTRPHAACGRMRTARFAHLHTPFSCCSRCTEPEWLCGPTCQPHAALRPCAQHPDAFRSAANLHLAIRNGARMRVRASALPMLIDLVVHFCWCFGSGCVELSPVAAAAAPRLQAQRLGDHRRRCVRPLIAASAVHATC